MDTEFNPVLWKAKIRERRGRAFNDALAKGVVRFISIHAFKTSNDENWPNQHLPEVFGASRIMRGRYRICRNLHGFNVTIAHGVFLMAHAARLSDMVEAVFGKYRLEAARAKWNFSEKAALLDLEREPLITKALKELETVLLHKGVLPAPEHMAAIRALGVTRPGGLRGTDIAALKRRVDELEAKLTKKLDDLEISAGIKLEELEGRLNEIQPQIKI